jgi:hypothetical protein
MSLKSIDITKVKRLSLKDVKLPAQEVIDTPIQVERPPTDAEIAFNKTALNNPVLKAIAERLDLNAMRVGKLLNKGKNHTKKDAVEGLIEKTGGYQDIQAGSIAYSPGKTFTYYNMLTGKEDIIKDTEFIPQITLRAEIKGARAKAERIFNKMLDKGTIKETGIKNYYSILVSNENKVI